MRFKIVSTGWQCADWIDQTLVSVESQTLSNWDIWITYDPSDDDGAKIIQEWCDTRDERWNYQINPNRRFAVQNQYEAIKSLQVEDDDIVIFLDLDGDRLAHDRVLERLASFYEDNTLVTYGSYVPVPAVGPPGRIEPYPAQVVRERSYRRFTLDRGCYFNHLRTMKGRIVNNIPLSNFQWDDGQWYQVGVDYVYMMAALELANGRYKCIKETLLLYNHANPLADNISHGQAGKSCVLDCLSRPPLPPLEP